MYIIKKFAFNNISQFFQIVSPILILSILFSSHFPFVGSKKISLLISFIEKNPMLFCMAFVKFFFTLAMISVFLFFVSSYLSSKFKIVFIFLFFLSCIARMVSFYPSLSENWFISKYCSKVIQYLSTLPFHSVIRHTMEWLPFCLVLIFLTFNVILQIQILIKQSRAVKKGLIHTRIDDFIISAHTFSMQGISLVLSIVLGSIFLSILNPSLRIRLPRNDLKQKQPNVFLFVVDSLRCDRLTGEHLNHVMPFLKSKILEAALFSPMLVGTPLTFPSLVEIATGRNQIANGIRTMISPRGNYMGNKQTIFRIARKNGYSVFFVTDIAEDLFLRYPFNGNAVKMPASNHKFIVENALISILTPLQAVLVFPKWHRFLPTLLESSHISDPRLLGQTFAKSLSNSKYLSKPVFVTTFFSLRREIPNMQTSNATSLYDDALLAIDSTLKELFKELEKKGWLQNAMILVFGNHGINLPDDNFSHEYKYSLSGEHSTVTPLFIFLKGNTAREFFQPQSREIVRSVDIAPTILKRLQLNSDGIEFDGIPLLDIPIGYRDKKSKKLNLSAYMETGLRSVQERAWVNKNYKLIARTTTMGVQISLYRRSDILSRNNLLSGAFVNPSYLNISKIMLMQMNDFLKLHGVEIVKNAKNSFFYAEDFQL